jgi:nondiscriminating glutamyl-tRNA synthetase
MSKVRVRFAPSPTGWLHIGGLRTALYCYLFAKQNDGDYLLRIEDTDRTRLVEGAIENLYDSLKWAGIENNEGVKIEDGKVVQIGECGPYIQSERLDIYRKYVDQLLESGHAYYCFCTKERLDEVREKQKANGEDPKYDGHCRDISLDEARKRIEAGEDYVVRLKLPENKDITFHDLVRGEITINTNDIDDQVLLKTDGFPTYHMAVVVDDHLMGITHVVRGEEWMTSAPKHVYLYEALGWKAAEFVHLPTVLNKEKKKLSKRHGDVAVGDFKKKGYLPEALVNYLALVGWSPEGNQEIFSMSELIESFSFDRVSRTGGVFDNNKLDWMNAHYIREADISYLSKLCAPYLVEAGYIKAEEVELKQEWIESMVESVRKRMSYLSQIGDLAEVFFNDNVEMEDEQTAEMLKGEQVPALFEAFRSELSEIDEVDKEFAGTVFKKIQKATGIKGKNLFMPLRALLTGQLHGPELVDVLFVLGKDKILNRMKYVEENIM